ncbi:MAG: SprB repeat-containing protein [Chitinophagales bacterium]
MYTMHTACADSSTAVIAISYAVTGSVTGQTNVSCFGGADGSITVDLDGSIPPYLYSLNERHVCCGQYVYRFNKWRIYEIDVTTQGCSDFKSVTISQ